MVPEIGGDEAWSPAEGLPFAEKHTGDSKLHHAFKNYISPSSADLLSSLWIIQASYRLSFPPSTCPLPFQ